MCVCVCVGVSLGRTSYCQSAILFLSGISQINIDTLCDNRTETSSRLGRVECFSSSRPSVQHEPVGASTCGSEIYGS